MRTVPAPAPGPASLMARYEAPELARQASRNTLSLISCVTKIATVGTDLILYQFSRSKVKRGDFSHFLGLYAPDKLPEGRRLREMMNCFVFCVEGWDDDPREIHLIPEVRRFYSAFHEAWPYWLYFCNLDVDTLRSMVMCCLPDVSTLQVDGKTKVAVTFDPLDVLNFIKHDFMPMNLMCDLSTKKIGATLSDHPIAINARS